jgi:serine/threonine-protein kinase
MPLALKKGEVLHSRYRILERIGQGGMGNIYLADDTRLEGRKCALKEVEYDRGLPPTVLQQAQEQFLREATVLARLDHPNLPKVSDFFSGNLREYLVMDYVPGKDLRDLMMEARRKKAFLPEPEVLGWAGQLADALNFLHQQDPPIIHRDIKPSNLKITPNNVLKLVDFGLVKIMAPDEVTITIIQGQGTALYTPMEQYGSDDAHTDIRADIFSMGATFYHLLTNEPPSDARRRFLDSDSLLPLREINSKISPRTENAILWAMALHPDDRPQNVVEFRDALLGDANVPTQSGISRSNMNSKAGKDEMLAYETIMGYAAGVLFLTGLIATLFH